MNFSLCLVCLSCMTCMWAVCELYVSCTWAYKLFICIAKRYKFRYRMIRANLSIRQFGVIFLCRNLMNKPRLSELSQKNPALSIDLSQLVCPIDSSFRMVSMHVKQLSCCCCCSSLISKTPNNKTAMFYHFFLV